ncbi:restriction endonuclease subunit S [Pseudomonas fluorescens]|uniref:restriction endonuclease subunit S n=1 Tax=Pseudomonas fluorescens TaxID=294 RepID=UPI003CFC6B44
MSELPVGWAETTLGEVADWGSGGTPSRSEPSFYGGTIPWIKSGELNSRYVTTTEEFITEAAIKNSSAKLFPAGSVAIAMYGATIGKTAILGVDASTNQACAVGAPSEGIIGKEFLYRLLQNEKEAFIEKGKGGAQPNISQAVIKAHGVNLPPLVEQTRIVQKLDELLAQVDTLKARIDTIPALLKRFRHSVLAAAVSGRLTDEWRATKQEPAINLDSLEDVSRTRRGVPQNVKLPDELDSLEKPDSWVWCSAAKLLKKGVFVDLKDGNHGANHPKTIEFTAEGLPFITAANVADHGAIDYLNAPKVSGDALAKLRVGFSDPGDVIFTHKGTVGRVAINTQKCVLTPQTTYYRINPRILSNKYLSIYLRSNRFLAQTDAIKSQTTRDFIPITAQYELFHLIPPLNEQSEVVRRIEQLFAFADQLEAKVASAKSRIDHLTQSILAKAFRGELVPQDPNDEPASVLLERIKAQRAAAPKAKRGQKGVRV